MRPPANNMPHYTASWIKLADVSTEIRIMPDMLVFQDDAIKNRHYSTTCRDENELRKLHRAGLIDMNTHATEHVMLNSGHILLSVDGAVQLFNTYRARYYDAEEIMCFLVGHTDRETAMFTHFTMIIVETRVRVMDRRVTIFDPRSQLLSDYDDNTLTRTFLDSLGDGFEYLRATRINGPIERFPSEKLSIHHLFIECVSFMWKAKVHGPQWLSSSEQLVSPLVSPPPSISTPMTAMVYPMPAIVRPPAPSRQPTTEIPRKQCRQRGCGISHAYNNVGEYLRAHPKALATAKVIRLKRVAVRPLPSRHA